MQLNYQRTHPFLYAPPFSLCIKICMSTINTSCLCDRLESPLEQLQSSGLGPCSFHGAFAGPFAPRRFREPPADAPSANEHAGAPPASATRPGMA